MIFQGDRKQIMRLAKNVSLLLLDVDGVMTDGRLYVGANGEELKVFNSLDGHGIKLLQRSGVTVGIVSGRHSPSLLHRARELDIELLYTGREDKMAVLEEIIATRQIDSDQIAYAGDDLPDLSLVRRVGLGISVPGGHPEVRNIAELVTERGGGDGAVREICDLLLQARDSYRQVVADSLRG